MITTTGRQGPRHSPRRGPRGRHHALWRLAGPGILAALLATPRPAWAHGYLKTALPAPNAQVATPIRELRLDFSEFPELPFTVVQLLDPGGNAIALGALHFPTDSHRAVVAPLAAALTRTGTYTVVWQMAGADGHVMRGRYTFTALAGAVSATTSRGGEAAAGVTPPGATPVPAAHHVAVTFPGGAAFSADSPAYVVIRWLTFVALLTLLGAIAFRLFVLSYLRREAHPHFPMLGEAQERAARVAWIAVWLLALATVLRFLAQSYAMHGTNVLDPSFVLPMVLQTVWGWGWLLQVAALTVAAIGFRAATRGRGTGWTIATIGTVALAFTPSLSGHAASAPHWTPLAIAADGLHVIGAGGWLGSLLFVIGAGIPATRTLPGEARGAAVADLVNAFSPTALVFAGLATATGVFAAWLHLGSIPALWQTRYGLTLLTKLAVLSIAAATGAYNWLRVKPALGSDVATARLRRSATIELVVGVVVLGITAVLVATPTAMDLRMMSAR